MAPEDSQTRVNRAGARGRAIMFKNPVTQIERNRAIESEAYYNGSCDEHVESGAHSAVLLRRVDWYLATPFRQGQSGETASV